MHRSGKMQVSVQPLCPITVQLCSSHGRLVGVHRTGQQSDALRHGRERRPRTLPRQELHGPCALLGAWSGAVGSALCGPAAFATLRFTGDVRAVPDVFGGAVGVHQEPRRAGAAVAADGACRHAPRLAMHVSDVMTSEVVSVTETTPSDDVVALLAAHRPRRYPSWTPAGSWSE